MLPGPAKKQAAPTPPKPARCCPSSCCPAHPAPVRPPPCCCSWSSSPASVKAWWTFGFPEPEPCGYCGQRPEPGKFHGSNLACPSGSTAEFPSAAKGVRAGRSVRAWPRVLLPACHAACCHAFYITRHSAKSRPTVARSLRSRLRRMGRYVRCPAGKCMAVASRAPVRPRHARPAQISFERNQRVSGLRRIAARSAGGLRSRAQPPVVASPSPAPSRAVTALARPPPPAPFGTPSVTALARLRSPVSRGPLPATPRALVGKGHACRAPLSRRRRWARAAPAPARPAAGSLVRGWPCSVLLVLRKNPWFCGRPQEMAVFQVWRLKAGLASPLLRSRVAGGLSARLPLRSSPAPATSPARPKPSRRKGARAAPLWLVFRWLRFRRWSRSCLRCAVSRRGRVGLVVAVVRNTE